MKLKPNKKFTKMTRTKNIIKKIKIKIEILITKWTNLKF
jgi:hypothetical protein